MKIYINENIIEAENITDNNDILELVGSNLEDEVIDTIELVQVEIA